MLRVHSIAVVLRMSDSDTTVRTFRRDGILLVILLLAAVVPFLPAVRGGFVWDDEELHVGPAGRVGNPVAFFLPGGGGGAEGRAARGNYYPVSMLAFWCEYRMFGRETTGYHVVNLVLHAGNVVLVWVLLRRLKAPARGRLWRG